MKFEIKCGCGWHVIADGQFYNHSETLQKAYEAQRKHTCFKGEVSSSTVDAVSSVGFQRVAEPEMDIGETYAHLEAGG